MDEEVFFHLLNEIENNSAKTTWKLILHCVCRGCMTAIVDLEYGFGIHTILSLCNVW